MAALLRASFHGLRCSRLVPSPYLSSQRELLNPPRELLKTPESSFILWRWYGETAALEDTCSSAQTVNNTAGENRAVIQGEDSSNLAAEKSLKEMPTANAVKQECAAKEPPSALNTDKLSGLIMGKLRSKNNLNGPKDNGVTLQAESTSSKAVNKLPEATSQQIPEDKWAQVMDSMRNMAAKRKANVASGGAMHTLAKSGEGENQDDFADLDLPQAQDEAVPSSKADSFRWSAMDASRNSTPNVKRKEGEIQGLNGKQKAGNQQKAKEAKPTSFSFLKSLDATASTSGVAEDESHSRSLEGSLSRLRSTLEESRSKTSDLLNGSSHEAKSAFSHQAKNVASHELERGFVEDLRKERASSYAKEVTSVINRTNYPGYTVCIRNLPSQSNLALVKEALSLHGEVISSFKKSNSDGSCNAFLEFKTAEAMDGALASRWLTVDSKAFSIVRADAPITTVVRLSKVSGETTDSQLASICEKFGSFDHIKRRGNGIYDVFYKANELSNMPTILDSLNEVMLNQRRLVALPAPLLHPSIKKEVLKRSEGQAWHASQLSQTLNRIEMGLEIVSVCFEDLKSLTAMEDELTKLL